ASSILPKIAEFFNLYTIETGSILSKKNLNVHVVPFLSQADYDQLLASCDINFVRGEDSWIRAIWAAKPFIWQPYLQTENTHVTKLNAFLDLFYADCEAHTKAAIYKAHSAWVT
ncbi:MAG: elongation factor P maturation arginine rhamnosyltransferase EarP, partial [Pseudomonadota bacterium]